MIETPVFKLKSRAAAEGFTRAGENRGRPQNGFSKGKGLRKKQVAPEEQNVKTFREWQAGFIAHLRKIEATFWELPDGTILVEKLGRLSPEMQREQYQHYLDEQIQQLIIA